MSEARVENRIRQKAKPYWIDHKHRDLSPGVTDLSFTIKDGGPTGWMEVKFMKLPARRETVPKTKWTPLQREWMRARGQAGAPCFIVLGIGGDILLFWWEVALEVINLAPTHKLKERAQWTSSYKDFDGKEFCKAITAIELGWGGGA
jgi:hypothetical protein